MIVIPLTIERVGLVTAVGLSAESTCAAIRSKISNATQTRFLGSNKDWIIGHQVELRQPDCGLARLARMAALSIEEALLDTPRGEWGRIPLLLCLAERDRPGRPEELDERLVSMIEAELEVRFAAGSAVVAQGQTAIAAALVRARSLLETNGARQVVIAAVDSLLSWPTLRHHDRAGRLLGPANSNAFLPGEAAGAIRVGAPRSGRSLRCVGIGLGEELACADSELPLRADGLVQALQVALAEAGCSMRDIDFRIADMAGEHYAFKEAALALSRTLRGRNKAFDLWHPAECTGAVGAASGPILVAVAKFACEKGYADGHQITVQFANDGQERAALVLQFLDAA